MSRITRKYGPKYAKNGPPKYAKNGPPKYTRKTRHAKRRSTRRSGGQKSHENDSFSRFGKPVVIKNSNTLNRKRLEKQRLAAKYENEFGFDAETTATIKQAKNEERQAVRKSLRGTKYGRI
jgi:hypothetical protein